MRQNNLLSITVLFSFILLVMTVLSYFLILPKDIPLFYSLSRPQDQLAQKEFIFIFPFLSIFFSIVLFLFSQVLEKKELPLLLLSYAAIFEIFLLSLAFIRIVFLAT